MNYLDILTLLALGNADEQAIALAYLGAGL
jgi:hypothetical protein